MDKTDKLPLEHNVTPAYQVDDSGTIYSEGGCFKEGENVGMPFMERSSAMENMTWEDSFTTMSSNGCCNEGDRSDLYLGKIFESKKEVLRKLKMIVVSAKFQFKTKKSNPSLVFVKCIVEECTWRVRVVKLANSSRFVVKNYCGEHNCGIKSAAKYHKQASYDVVAEMMRKFFDSSGQGPIPKELLENLESKTGSLGNHKREGYSLLPGYRRIFSYEDSDFCRWDGKYGGVLISACAQDGNQHIFPLAFAVFDSENDNSWTYFFKKLAECIPDSDNLCVISDRHQSIKTDVANVYTLAHHGFYMFHFSMNLKSRSSDCDIIYNFLQAAKAYTLDEFSLYFDAIVESNVNAGVIWSTSHVFQVDKLPCEQAIAVLKLTPGQDI
ncbi:PREDICTED: uncharacterized protein LOC109211751 [Nicotiana attenuata]|uniref:uncharacterized protein LOC109211751 n=1 Tax=Nicotiana attenuata TaxID=49451 RepID=UPI0009050432|nr:PREDICTED: uncharacterized protein LOC109211751 [Nicotiana attenuata]